MGAKGSPRGSNSVCTAQCTWWPGKMILKRSNLDQWQQIFLQDFALCSRCYFWSAVSVRKRRFCSLIWGNSKTKWRMKWQQHTFGFGHHDDDWALILDKALSIASFCQKKGIFCWTPKAWWRTALWHCRHSSKLSHTLTTWKYSGILLRYLKNIYWNYWMVTTLVTIRNGIFKRLLTDLLLTFQVWLVAFSL